jgi:CubicO group peptidase (beta-lactamase class C family)
MRNQRHIGTVILFFFGAGLFLFLAGCETRASLIRKRIRGVEKGLLKAVYIKGTQPERMSLGERMDFYKVPGVGLAVLDGHRVEWVRSYGVGNIAAPAAVTPETLFQAGALGRSLSAAAALRWVGEGKVGLDDDLGPRLDSIGPPRAPGDEGEKPITMRNLLSDSAGLSGRDLPGFPANAPVPDLGRILGGLPPELPPVWEGLQPGRVRESESGYSVIQMLMTGLEGKPFPRILKESLLDPLGLADSTFEAVLPAEMAGRAAAGHLREGPPVGGGWLLYPESAAKGLWTTPGDYAAFLVEILNGARGGPSRILSAESARSMLTVQAGDRSFGFAVEDTGEETVLSLKGRTRGFTGFAVLFPSRGQGIVILTNSDNGDLLTGEILRAASATYGWPRFQPEERPLFRLDPTIIEQYVGRYKVTDDYFLDVRSEDYYLVIQPTGQAPTKFFVESGTIFFSIDPYIRIQFRRDDRGAVNGLVLWQQDFEQQAVKVQ